MRIPFRSEFEIPMLKGQKTATTRTKKYGNPGDLFSAFGHAFMLTNVDKVYLGYVCSVFYRQEGFNSQGEFIEYWNKIHPRKHYHYSTHVYLHQFILTSQKEVI